MSTKIIEYLSTTRLGERGTMTLPKDYRDDLNLETGSAFTVLRIGDGLMLIPEQKRFDELCNSIASRLEAAGATEAALQGTLAEVRDSVARKHYPELFPKTTRKRGSTKR